MVQNPLDEFNSHSVHYVVLACRSTEDVRAFSDGSPTAMTASLQAIDACQTLGAEVQYKDSSGVFLMIDTRRFSQFTISNFKMDTLMAGLAVPGSSSPNATAVNMEFTVTDSVGVSFANFLQYLMDQKLQVSFDGMTLMVRVLFIGHHLDGTSSVVQSVTIPAIFNQIKVDLNDVRGLYECTCFPLIGMPSNAGYNAKWTNIGRASSFFTGEGKNTLGAMVNSFEDRVNKELLERYTSANGQAQNQGTKKSVGHFGRPVQYMITIPADWEAYTFTGPTGGAAVETNFAQLVKDAEEQKAKTAAEAQKKAQENTKAPTKDSYLGVPTECTVTEVLDIIFGQVVKIRELANFTRTKGKDGNIRFYKHLITVTSDDTSFTVHIDVVEFIVPNALLTSDGKAAAAELDNLLYRTIPGENGNAPKKVPRNYLEYDYIFSGKNLDIIGLDLKIENLNWLLMSNTKLGQVEMAKTADDGQKQTDGDGAAEDKRILGGMRKKDPALMPPRTYDETRNHSHIGNVDTEDGATAQAISQQYMQNLAAYYNAGPITTKLELRGNPELMASVSLTALPKHANAVTITDAGGATSGTNLEVKKQYRENFERNLLRIAPDAVKPSGPVDATLLSGPSFVSSPVFVKVNVYGPNVDYLSNELIAGQDFSKKLFGDNFYYLSKITSKIEGTRFTQEMELQSFSVYGHPSKNAQGADVSTVKKV